jgi:hypothetical protein
MKEQVDVIKAWRKKGQEEISFTAIRAGKFTKLCNDYAQALMHIDTLLTCISQLEKQVEELAGENADAVTCRLCTSSNAEKVVDLKKQVVELEEANQRLLCEFLYCGLQRENLRAADVERIYSARNLKLKTLFTLETRNLRNETIEECAKVAEARMDNTLDKIVRATAWAIRDAIRKLKQEGE